MFTTKTLIGFLFILFIGGSVVIYCLIGEELRIYLESFYCRFKLVRVNYMLVVVPRHVLGRGTRNAADYSVKNYFGSAVNEHFPYVKKIQVYVLVKQRQHFAISLWADCLLVLLLMDGRISLCQVSYK